MRKIITTLLLGIIALGCMAQDGDEEGYPRLPYQYHHDRLNKPLKVKGGAGIEQFMKATGLFEDDEIGHDYSLLDKGNGYFKFSQEGAGGYHVEAAYWNRTDGKKMFIIRYWVGDFGMGSHASKLEKENEWFKLKTKEMDDSNFMFDEIGCMAYLYNPATLTLEPMQKPPFNNLPKTDGIYVINPPQRGKDIKVQVLSIEDEDMSEEHTLKFNGLTFDYVK